MITFFIWKGMSEWLKEFVDIYGVGTNNFEEFLSQTLERIGVVSFTLFVTIFSIPLDIIFMPIEVTILIIYKSIKKHKNRNNMDKKGGDEL